MKPAQNPLFIKGTSKSPQIDFSAESLLFSGRSILENTEIFYRPVVNWLKAYLQNPEPLTRMVFQVDYINSASSHFVFRMVSMINEFKANGGNISIEWHYHEDDDNIKTLGEDLLSMFPTLFKLIVIP